MRFSFASLPLGTSPTAYTIYLSPDLEIVATAPRDNANLLDLVSALSYQFTTISVFNWTNFPSLAVISELNCCETGLTACRTAVVCERVTAMAGLSGFKFASALVLTHVSCLGSTLRLRLPPLLFFVGVLSKASIELGEFELALLSVLPRTRWHSSAVHQYDLVPFESATSKAQDPLIQKLKRQWVHWVKNFSGSAAIADDVDPHFSQAGTASSGSFSLFLIVMGWFRPLLLFFRNLV